MSETEEGNDKGPDKEESIPTASMGGSEVGQGGQIGPYKLLSIVGEGGFGVVYLAERQRPVKRRVALKVIKPGMDTKQVIARFEAERQALALLEHPNIAHVFNAGTTYAGRPYFVMEYVKGIPITEHCDRHKLTIEERLKLFLLVCEAIQHAHQKGIIHRDIKPSNIQVCIEGEKAVPKVIDFGVAKAISQPLTERTLVTEEGQFIGTPEYMSPEQAEMTGQDVDTRSYIYSLGVVLYELLTGVLPFDAKTLREGGVDHIRHMILEEEPKTPSTRLSTIIGDESTKVARSRRTDIRTLARKLHGDLDWITIKAMEKERTRRYQTSHALAEDIQRHLVHEPVSAGPPSQIYRLKKLLRKYRTQAIAAAMAAVLLAGIAVVSAMYIRALNRGEEAEFLKHNEILSKAMELRSNGQFQNALTKVDTIVDSKHIGPKARLLRARLILEVKGPADAVKELEKLLNERDEIAGQAHLLLAKIYYESDPDAPGKTEGYRLKWEYHRLESEKLVPETADAYLLRAISAGTVRKTVDLLNKALELDEKHYDSLRERAYLSYATNNYHKMAKDAARMIGIQPDNPLGYSLSAIAQRELKQYSETMEDHNKAIKLSPDDAEFYDQRRRTHMRMSNYEQALLDALKCIELQPEKNIYHFHAFCALVALGRYEEAKDKYDTIIESGLMTKRDFDLSAAKYVSDTLDAGLSWYPAERRPEGAAFLEMHESAETYEQLAKKAKRVVPKGYHPTWSPDGTELVYSRGVLNFSGIDILNLESGKTRLLTVPGFDPAWSPDGNYIAFTRHRQHLLLGDFAAERTGEDPSLGKREVWLIKADGTGEPRFLAKGYWPCWSRDSKRVLYNFPKDMKLYSISIEDGAKPIPIIPCRSSYPGVSPDEKYIAFRGRVRQIVDSSTNSVVASWTYPLAAGGGFPSWSPDGRELIMGDYSNSGLWIYDVENKQASKVLSGSFGWCRWSPPDKSKIVIERVYWTLHHEIWVADTSALKPGRTIEEHCQEMVDYYTRRIDTYPQDSSHYLSRAECYIYLQDEDKAFADLDEYAKIVKDSKKAGQVYASMAWSSVSVPGCKGDPAIAVHLAQKAIEKEKENRSYHSILGGVQYYAGEYENAITTLEQADRMYFAKVRRHHPLNAAFITMSLHRLGRSQEAEAALSKLRVMFEEGVSMSLQKYLIEAEQLFAGKDSNISHAWDCIQTGRLDRALELLSEQRVSPVEADPNFGARVKSVRRHLALQYIQRGSTNASKEEYDKVTADYESAIKADPNYALAYNDLAWFEATCPEGEFRNGTKATGNATKACELTNWKNAGYIDTLAAAYAEAGDFDEAIKWQKKAIDLLPKSQRSRNQLEFEARVNLYRAGQSYHGQPLFANQLIARWTFDQVKGKSVLDSSGNNLHGKLVGDAHIISDPQRGMVLSLDGDGDWVDCGRDIRFDITNNITVSAWIKVKKIDKSWQAIITKCDSAWRLSTYQDQRKPHFAVTSQTTGSNWVDGDSEVSLNKWHHVCGTYDGGHIRLYVDGVEDPQSPVTYNGKIDTNVCKLLIGENFHRPGREWNGLIDDVRIYSYALSEEQIKAIYAGKAPGPTSD